MKVYFVECNVMMDNTVYLPLVSGMLQAYVQTFPELKLYQFQPYIFVRDAPEAILNQIQDPGIVAFSVSIWNHQLSMVVAHHIKAKYPNSIIIFGGPQVSAHDQNPDIDYVVTEEGEKKFAKILAGIAGVNIDVSGHDLNDFPSPYALGMFDQTLANYNYNFQAIIETNRGCPFSCSFCYWGQGFAENKVRHHSLERVRAEAEWIGRNKIPYIFIADANFGMYERDQDVATIYAEVKAKTGYPDKIRVCYGKNKEENVYKTATILHKAGLAKSVTMSRQSSSETVLKAIRRANIKPSTYDALACRYSNDDIPTYSEFILGLPGETLASFKQGLDSSPASQLFIYHCTVLPNTEMASPEYMAKYGIRTVTVPLTEIHGEVRKPEHVLEYEDIVVETNTMTMLDWIEGAVYAWMIQLQRVFGIKDVPESIISEFYGIAEAIVTGHSRGQVNPRFGNIYWEPEEMAYLNWCWDHGLINGDPKEFAKSNVLWGRKSRKPVS
jgi:putative methyltransferase